MFTQQELENMLREQIRFISDSCRSFDAGFEAEAKRLAVCVRVLVHDTTKSTSLISQLGIKTIQFYSTTPRWDSANLLGHISLLQVAYKGKNSTYRAPLDDRPPHLFRWIPFDEWWTDIVFDDRKGNILTRKDIVLALANKVGGAHVDPELTPSYEAITKYSSFWFLSTPEGDMPLPGNKEFLSMRQIAHELLSTLKHAGYTV